MHGVFWAMLFSSVGRAVNCVTVACSAGTFMNGAVCSMCPSGKFSNAGATNCITCPVGLSSPMGSSSCNTSYPMFMLLADGNLIRKVNLETSAVSTLSTTGNTPMFVAQYNDFVLFTSGNAVFRLDLGSMVVTTIAGQSGQGSTDGVGTVAKFKSPYDIKVSSNASFALVCDYGNNVLRMIVLPGVVVTTIAGKGTAGYADGSGLNIIFSQPACVDISSDGTFAVVSEMAGNRLRRINLTATPVTSSLIAGSKTGVAGSGDGNGTSAFFNNPMQLVISQDMKFVIVIDYLSGALRKVILSSGTVTTLTSLSVGFGLMGVASSADRVYISGSLSHRVYSMSTNNTVTVFAGTGTSGNADNANGLLAYFANPIGMAVIKCSLAGYGVNSSRCSQCAVGSYGSGVCTPCVNGTYSAVKGATACIPCASCAAGQYVISQCSSTANTVCTPCTQNNYCIGGVAAPIKCVAGTYCVDGVSAGIQCPAGMYCGPGVSSGTVCSIGYACPLGSSAQTPCTSPANAYFTGYGTGNAFSCGWACDVGYYLFNNMCFQCAAGSYDPGNGVCVLCQMGTYSAVRGLRGAGLCSTCNANTYSAAGATECTVCPAKSWSASGSWVCTANVGYYYSDGSLVQCPSGSYCVTGVSAGTLCPKGMYCSAGVSAGTACSIGSACPLGSSAQSPCTSPANSSFTGVGVGSASSCPWQCDVGFFLDNGTCSLCVACDVGTFQTSLCSNAPHGRNCAPCNVAKPTHSVFVTTTPSCPWVCDSGHWGSRCAPCPPNFWCRNGMRNKCPLNSASDALSVSQSNCTCQVGFMSTGRMAGTSPCVKCPAGVLCSGIPVQEVVVSPIPFVDVATQFMLARKPLAPADNIVSLFKDVPANVDSIYGMLHTPIYILQVCRGDYCMACEDSITTCIRSVVVGLQSLADGSYLANTTSLQRDVMYVFVTSDCALGFSGLEAESVSNNTVMISSAADVVSVRAVCTSNTSKFVDIPVDTY